MTTYALLDTSQNPPQVVSLSTNATGFVVEFVDITNASPQPGPGWTTTDGGATWTAPTASAIYGNQASLESKARTALTNNETYLGIASPTNAQVVSQVAALTRQVNALIRLAANALDSTTGT